MRRRRPRPAPRAPRGWLKGFHGCFRPRYVLVRLSQPAETAIYGPGRRPRYHAYIRIPTSPGRKPDMQLPYHDRYPYSPIVDRPDYSWPGGKRLAVYLGLNIEHFAFGAGEGHLLTVAGAPPDPRTF